MDFFLKAAPVKAGSKMTSSTHLKLGSFDEMDSKRPMIILLLLVTCSTAMVIFRRNPSICGRHIVTVPLDSFSIKHFPFFSLAWLRQLYSSSSTRNCPCRVLFALRHLYSVNMSALLQASTKLLPIRNILFSCVEGQMRLLFWR